MGALSVSLGAHAAALAVRFVDEQLSRHRSSETALEIILVNARSQTRPSDAQALAQVNLDGGGANDSGRRSSPLPSSFEVTEGDSLESARQRVQRLEREQKELLTRLAHAQELAQAKQKEFELSPSETGQDTQAHEKLARMQAEIHKMVSDYQKRPRKHHFMPSTSEYRFARYVEDWRSRLERIGNEHYPEQARGKFYGELRMTVVIGKDGGLIDAVVEKSSGSPILDRAARRIVRMAAPYAPFPPEMSRDTDVLEITRTWIFTNDQLATRGLGRNVGQHAP